MHRGNVVVIDGVIGEAAQFLSTRTPIRPRVAVVLGSGLGAFADELSDAVSIPYSEIPGFPQSTAIGHAGKLILGTIAGIETAVMAGRFHLYEGYSAAQAALGVRVLGKLGAKHLVVTNAAGGIGTHLTEGCLVLITDHINLQGQNPLTGANDPTLGPRFPDMTEAYSKRARGIAKQLNPGLKEGVYAALPGPSYETPAEIGYLRTIGADLVGMSTVPEVIAANHMGIEVLGISCVTNLAAGMSGKKLNHEEVLAIGERVRGSLVDLLKNVIPQLCQTP
jgi:purine-nucleoside phosphorylase